MPKELPDIFANELFCVVKNTGKKGEVLILAGQSFVFSKDSPVTMNMGKNVKEPTCFYDALIQKNGGKVEGAFTILAKNIPRHESPTRDEMIVWMNNHREGNAHESLEGAPGLVAKIKSIAKKVTGKKGKSKED